MHQFRDIEFTNSLNERILIRPFAPKKDSEAVFRLAKEIGWGTSKTTARIVEEFYSMGFALVGEINGSMECVAASAEGDMVYLDSTIPLEGVTSVFTGMPARRKGLAQLMTANLMMHNAANGAGVSVLGVFDLGFYNRLGYGTGPYQHKLFCDLSDLRPGQARVPVRLDPTKDATEIHKALLKRTRGHGGCNIYSENMTPAPWLVNVQTPNSFGLGYRNSDTNELTHFLTGQVQGENGPLDVQWLVWNNDDQLRELLGLIASLGDQIWHAKIPQPRGVALQDLVKRPLKARPVHTGQGADQFRAGGIRAYSSWQFRIMDMVTCVSKTKIRRGEVSFNLELSDPLEEYAGDDSAWRPLNGAWTVNFGNKSHAERGTGQNLPTLKASISAFSRLWGGGQSAHGLAITDDFHAPDALLDKLDDVMDLPDIRREWDF